MKYSNHGFHLKNKGLFRGMSTVFIAVLVVCLLLSTTVTYAAMTINRTSSSYNDSSPYRDFMQYRMNCYGYATQMYCGNYAYMYKQQPGEFAQNTEPWSSLEQSWWHARHDWYNMLQFTEDRVWEDYGTLNQYDNFGITVTTSTASVPCDKRKIALVVRQAWDDSDYHFYFRHSDGTWSHKQGWAPISNLSIDTHVAITDANIATVSSESGYDDGTRYYLINKAAVVDFPHNLGQSAAIQEYSLACNIA